MLNYQKPIFEVKNYGRHTRVFFCGVDISSGIRTVEYRGFTPKDGEANRMLLDFDIERLMETFANLSDEELEAIREQLQRYKRKEEVTIRDVWHQRVEDDGD